MAQADPSTDRVGPGPGVLWILAAGASALLIAGGTLLIRTAVATPGSSAETAVHANKPPSHFGLPAYPGAFGFHSLEAGTGRGSSAYSVRRGTAAEIGAFYRKKLEAAGWQYVARRPVSVQPGDATVPGVPPAKGFELRWQKVLQGRRMRLMALDYPHKSGSTAQVLVVWSPLEE